MAILALMLYLTHVLRLTPLWQEFVVRADENTILTEINWRDNPWFPESLERQRQRSLLGDAGRYAWIWEGKVLQISDSSILAKKLKVQDFEIIEGFSTPTSA